MQLDQFERGHVDWEEMLYVQTEADLYWNVDIASDLVGNARTRFWSLLL